MRFFLACTAGDLDEVKSLCEQVDPQASRHPLTGDNAIHVAAGSGRLSVVRYLINEKHCDPQCRVTQSPRAGGTPLHFACKNGHLDVVKYLVDELKVDILSREEALGLTPLHMASGFGHVGVMRYLFVEKKCDPMCRSNTGETPLHLAVGRGKLDAVKFLVSTAIQGAVIMEG